jgi:hypothetical protein
MTELDDTVDITMSEVLLIIDHKYTQVQLHLLRNYRSYTFVLASLPGGGGDSGEP